MLILLSYNVDPSNPQKCENMSQLNQPQQIIWHNKIKLDITKTLLRKNNNLWKCSLQSGISQTEDKVSAKKRGKTPVQFLFFSCNFCIHLIIYLIAKNIVTFIRKIIWGNKWALFVLSFSKLNIQLALRDMYGYYKQGYFSI